VSHGPALTLAELQRWELFGAKSRVVEVGGERAVVELCSCTGELVERRESDDPELIAHLRTLPREAVAD
jgi:hypothetical protein